MPGRATSRVVTQLFRNSPWLVLLFAIMLLLPFRIDCSFVVISIPGRIKAAIRFPLSIMVNISEVVRSAVQSLPARQWESAESLTFTRRQTMWQIILPQCFKCMIPPWLNWYCILAMATPICSIMGVEESVTFTRQALNVEGSRMELLFVFYTFLLVILFIYNFPITRWSISFEKKFAVKT